MTRDNVVGKAEVKLYEESLRAIDRRGGHATGIYTNGRIIKMPVTAREFLRIIHTLNKNYAFGATEILGHTRLATVGRYEDNKNNHPFMSRSFVFAHNGSYYSISGVKTVVMEYYSRDIPKTDSWELLAKIQSTYDEDNDVKTAIESALNDGYGAYAFWLYDREHDELYLYREDNPLHVAQAKGMILFASERKQLPKTFWKKAYQLKPYVLYKIDRSGHIKKEKLDIQEIFPYAYYGNYGKGWDDDDYEAWYGAVEKSYTPVTSVDSIINLVNRISQESPHVGYVKKGSKVLLYISDPSIAQEILDALDYLSVSYEMSFQTENYCEIEIPIGR